MPSKVIKIGYRKVKKVKMGGGGKNILIAGSCTIASQDHVFMMAEHIGGKSEKLKMDQVGNSRFDEECYASPKDFRGHRVEGCSQILADIRSKNLYEDSNPKMLLTDNQQLETLKRIS